MSGYIGVQPVPQATQARQTFTATSGQTTFATVGYQAGYLDVYLNGVKLVDGTDYTATNGSDVVLTTGAATDDTLEVVAFSTFEVAGQNFTGDFSVDTNTLYVDSTNNAVGIGTLPASDANLHVNGTNTVLLITEDSEGDATLRLGDTQGNLSQSMSLSYDTGSTNALKFIANGTTERMRIDSSGNLLVGTTSTATASTAGVVISASNSVFATRTSEAPLWLNRLSTDGPIAYFRKDGTTVGSIGTNGASGTDIFYGGTSTSLRFRGDVILPATQTGAFSDNLKDLGNVSVRFDDIYATNGTIQTSDRNEKQQIAELTAAEMQAAKAISALFKTFKWNDAVAEKGDAARTHSGVIAQEVEQAMSDAGLNAGDYAFFISSTWWETQTEVPAVEAVDEVLDEDGNVIQEAVEAKEAYTRTDTYETLEEAPEGATERTRKGIRYPELLAFVGAATEQRLASIEARLDILEDNECQKHGNQTV